MGHCAKAYYSRLHKRVAEVKLTEDQYDDECFWVKLLKYMLLVEVPESWKATVKLNGQPGKCKVDTGADVTVIPPSIFNKLKPATELTRTTKLLIGPCKQKLKGLGTLTAVLQEQDKVATEEIYVVEDLEGPLLGRQPAEQLKLVSRIESMSSNDYKNKVTGTYPKLFKGLGVMKDSYKITLQEHAKPFQLAAPKKAPLPLYRKTKDELDRMLQTGVISRVDQLSD